MDARETLMNAYLGMRTELMRFLKARLGQAAPAEDVYQDLYLRLSSTPLLEAIGEPRAFLYKMAYNLANDRIRASQRRRNREQAWQEATTHQIGNTAIADVPDIGNAIDAGRQLARVAGWIAGMPPRCREVFTLHRLHGASHVEVSSRLGISVKAVEKHMAKAYRILGQRARESEGGGNDGS